jgi:hypothetical protein
VSNAKKILAGMRRNSRNWRMEDLEVVARRFGVDVDSHKPCDIPAPEGGQNNGPEAHPDQALVRA